jgi:hypothetical protein
VPEIPPIIEERDFKTALIEERDFKTPSVFFFVLHHSAVLVNFVNSAQKIIYQNVC